MRRAAENDRLRTTLQGGRVVLSEGVWTFGVGTVEQVLSAVRNFDDFTPENDPCGQHDFGTFQIAGTKFVWRIDNDGTDGEVQASMRVLAIMLADEY